MEAREVDYWLVEYNDADGNVITKPFYDDEGGSLVEVCVVNVYEKSF